MRDGAVVALVRERLWNKLRVPGGWIRINELDGAIEVARGGDPEAAAGAREEADDSVSVHACRGPLDYKVVAEGAWKLFWRSSMWSPAESVQEKLCAVLAARHVQCAICKEDVPTYAWAQHLQSQEHFGHLMEAAGSSGLSALFAALEGSPSLLSGGNFDKPPFKQPILLNTGTCKLLILPSRP